MSSLTSFCKAWTCWVFKTSNTFDTLANDYKCYNFVDPILASLNGYFYGGGSLCAPPSILSGVGNPNIPSRCHIIDLSPYIEYYIHQPGSPFGCTDACPKAHWQSSLYGSTTSSNTFTGLSFNLSIFKCHETDPADKY